MRTVSRVFVLVASVFIGFLICEGIVRIVTPQEVNLPWRDDFEGIASNRPGIRSRHASPVGFDIVLTINSQRFRSRSEYLLEPPRGTTRIAVLGDSVTFGWGANDNDTYPAHLERILGSRSAEGGHRLAVEVLNTGVDSTGTGEQALWYDRWVRRFRPHVVILSVFPNDLEEDMWGSLFRLDARGRAYPRPMQILEEANRLRRRVRNVVYRIPGYAFLAQRSQLLTVVRNTVSSAIALRRAAFFADGQQSLPDEDALARAREKGLSMMSAELRWLNDRVDKSGARLVVVFIPSRERVYASRPSKEGDPGWGWESEKMVEVLRITSFEEGIPFADLTPLLRNAARRTAAPLYFRSPDIHPNPLGYRVIAECVARVLIDNGLMRSTLGS